LRIAALLPAVLLAGCVQLPVLPAGPDVTSSPPAERGALAERIGPAEAAHPGQSGFRLLSDGTEAFLIRAQSARLAVQSLDVQTYIWHADLTGAYLGQVLLDAADRGVRVRLLVDDLDARAKNDGFAALAAHPHIEVRLFNPWATRNGKLSQAGESAFSFERINRRMHNKSWIADNRIAVVGGRNVGDEYFGAGQDVNFVDLDFAMLGPVVREVSYTFDRFWNSSSAYPMEVLAPEGVNDDALIKLRNTLAGRAADARDSPYATALRGEDLLERMAGGGWPLQWASKYEFVSDDPDKVTMKKRDVRRTHVGVSLVPMLQSARARVAIISPYFVPGKEVTEGFSRMAAAGRSVRVLTNSLVANDVAAVHGGYSRYRKALLEGGVQLWELKPTGSPGNSSVFGSSGASLHTKAFVVDGERLFVGSYNLDPRSTWLNCEQGVIVEDAVLARELEALFERQIGGSRAWRVILEDGGLRWTDGEASYEKDPKASAWQRFQAWATRVLHLDAQL
jgi:putative cardiolipin synthase